MNASPATTLGSFNGPSGDATIPPRHRDGAPSAFAQTLRRLERDMWQAAAAGHTRSTPDRTASPLAARPILPAIAPDPARCRSPVSATASQSSIDHRASARHDATTAAPVAPGSGQHRQVRLGGRAPSSSNTLAPPLPISSAHGARSVASIATSLSAPATSRPPHIHAGDIAPRPASGLHYRLGVLTGEAGLSIAVRAAGIEDSILAQRAFAELRRLGVSAPRLFINGRLFIETHRLSGETHGD
ncbi:TPA: hypothetical protein SAY52_005803 [Burkholderia cenocepacia]|uniref:hypothetical protein n=1 Tax=unclassified Burkholderia TaxID=2613784 RepID=UPI00158B0DAF|nr:MULTISPECIES: hypothetical protein [unclassified Burkholderia]HEF5875111.1 hypothetical protein [Burkholderia cenocepacia]